MKITKICLKNGSKIEIGGVRDNFGTVKEIVQHAAQGEGDKWFWDVVYSDGEVQRFFDIDSAYFTKE